MYPFGDLPANLAAFCGDLRRQHGFRIGPGELRDAARAFEVVNPSDEHVVRHALRAILATDRVTADAFDKAFDAFFYPGPPGVAQRGLPALEPRHARPGEGVLPGARRAAERAGESAPELDGHGEADDASLELDDGQAEDEEDHASIAGARYSPLEAQGLGVVRVGPVSPEWQAGARALVHRLRLGLSRRWRPARAGRRLDLRRTLRGSLQVGGEALVLRRLARRRRTPRLVVLVDGSRSMGTDDVAGLELAVALASVTRRVEAFTFSTTLRRVTRHVRQAAAGTVVALRLPHGSWGGGTNIGKSLREFLQRHGERLVGRETLVVIVSDGLDVGDTSVLRDALSEMRRRAAGILWFNPLLDTPGYEPTSLGMATARPYLSTLAGSPAPEQLARVAPVVRMR